MMMQNSKTKFILIRVRHESACLNTSLTPVKTSLTRINTNLTRVNKNKHNSKWVRHRLTLVKLVQNRSRSWKTEKYVLIKTKRGTSVVFLIYVEDCIYQGFIFLLQIYYQLYQQALFFCKGIYFISHRAIIYLITNSHFPEILILKTIMESWNTRILSSGLKKKIEF